MTLSRKFFAASVTLPATTATSMATLMQGSILHWWEETDGSPSLDSAIGDEASIVPDGAVFVGSDANVRDANADPLYKGVTVGANATYSLQDFGGRGNLDPKSIWFYATAQRVLALTFQGA